MNDNDWGNLAGKFSLPQGEVHVLRIDLDRVSTSRLPSLSILADEEIKRANHIHLDMERKRFITRRILFRVILSRYLAVEPGKLEFDYNPYGKPSLKQPAGSSICFNTAHSEQFALFTFCLGNQLGVDIERIRLDIDYENIAGQYFTPGERSAIMARPGDDRSELFYTFWTRKEAYIKGRGMGLSIPLDGFDVSQTNHGVFYPVEYVDDKQKKSEWILLDLPSTRGFAGALAVEHGNQVITTWEWTESILA
jgi:4'-phosphopantetheinyl transferase